MMDERNLEIILDAVAEKIRDLKTSVMLKDMEIDRLKAENKRLEEGLERLYARLGGKTEVAQDGDKN